MNDTTQIPMTRKVELMTEQIHRYTGFRGMRTAVMGARIDGNDLELRVALFDHADEIHVRLKEGNDDVRN